MISDKEKDFMEKWEKQKQQSIWRTIVPQTLICSFIFLITFLISEDFSIAKIKWFGFVALTITSGLLSYMINLVIREQKESRYQQLLERNHQDK